MTKPELDLIADYFDGELRQQASLGLIATRAQTIAAWVAQLLDEFATQAAEIERLRGEVQDLQSALSVRDEHVAQIVLEAERAAPGQGGWPGWDGNE